MPSLTVIAQRAYEAFGAVDPSGTLTAAVLTQAQAVANDLLDNMSSDNLLAVAATVAQHPLTNGTAVYTIGPGGTWAGPRPVAVKSASIILGIGAASLIDPVKVCNAIEWENIPDRSSSSARVRYLFYDRQMPYGSVYLSPTPVAGQIELVTWQPFNQFPDQTTSIIFPPGFARFFGLALGRSLALRYNRPFPPDSAAALLEARAAYQTLNQTLLWPTSMPNETGAAPQADVTMPG